MMRVEYKDGRMEKGLNSITRPGDVHVIHENGDVYDGHVIQSNSGEYVPHGKGSYKWKAGTSYEGSYDHGLKHGLGAYHYRNGTIYRGSWKNGVKSGPGTITYTNGDTFSGVFADDMKNGKGCYTYASTGAQLLGEWHHGEVVSGKWIFPSGRPVSSKSLKGSALIPGSMEVDPTKKSPPLGIIISGAPASGKGTQCERIREEYGLVHLSTGDMLRAAVAAGTEVGKKAKEIMEAGGLVPDDVVIGAIKERLAQPDVQEHGFLLDGFPRTPAQAEALKSLGLDIHVFLMLDVPDELILERVTGRRIDPETGNSYHVTFKPPPEEIEHRLIQRKDDTEECVKPRLQNFHQNIANVRGHFEDVLVQVDGTGKPHEVWDTINEKLAGFKSKLS
jgi:adenylate kinase